MNISVIIPTYNRRNLLKRALKSVYNQSYFPQEIIILDDGSKKIDNNIQKEYNQIRYFYRSNGGVSSARNEGIKRARCDWIAFLDDDDEWEKDKLLYQVKLHKLNPNLKMSYTNERWIRGEKEVKIPKKYQKHEGDIFKQCLSHCFIAPSSVLIKKDLFSEIGYFDESLTVCEDYDLWLKISSIYPIGLESKPLTIKYAGHVDQLSFKYWGMDRFRVKSLQNLYYGLEDIKQKKMVKDEIIKKINLLIKGSIKHNRLKMTKEYEKILKEFT